MNIYVGNLSYSLTESELRVAFAAFGHVSSVNILRDRESGRSRGFGFVEVPDQAEADAAVMNLNGKDLDGPGTACQRGPTPRTPLILAWDRFARSNLPPTSARPERKTEETLDGIISRRRITPECRVFDRVVPDDAVELWASETSNFGMETFGCKVAQGRGVGAPIAAARTIAGAPNAPAQKVLGQFRPGDWPDELACRRSRQSGMSARVRVNPWRRHRREFRCPEIPAALRRPARRIVLSGPSRLPSSSRGR